MINCFGDGKEPDICGLCYIDRGGKKRLSHELLYVLLVALPAVCTLDFPLTVL